MNWTCKLLAVALATVASLSVDLYAQSTLDSQLNKRREQMKLFSLESTGACGGGRGFGESSGSGGPYADAEAYQVYSAIIPIINPNPETHTWFIRIDTLPMGRGSFPPADLSNPAREEGEQSREQRVADIALDDYSKVNAKTWLLQRNFTLPNPYKLVTREQLQATFPPNFRGGNFGELWLQLSAVGFNADKTLAVVYMSHALHYPMLLRGMELLCASEAERQVEGVERDRMWDWLELISGGPSSADVTRRTYY